ncbi:DMT family transporter [Simiduia curdlanivorans]|uniref:DMT family transporter n=1 Tax=Simiduia curdlanivorans TaxID=1492769 RepID=A0ABV8V2C1_9GAMM|nr:DMT family transporter [Simiduia curdlanivorans]MDN3637858.1 DMT family transporter [Simiduia curdlanivorans]
MQRAIAFSLLTSFVASLVAAGSKLAAQHVSVHMVVFSQYLVGFCLYLPLLIKRGTGAFQTQRLGLHLGRGLAGLGAFYAYYSAILHVPLIDATLLRNSAPLLVPLLALWFLGIRVPSKRWWPLAIGFAGVLVILRPSPANLNIWHLVGFSAAWMMAASMITTRLLTKTESNTTVLLYYFTIALLVSAPMAIYTATSAPLWVWLLLLVLGLGLALALWLYTLAYRAAKPSVLSPVSYMSVVFAGAWGWLFWLELPSLWSFIGTALVVISACVILWLGDPDTPVSPRPPA